MWIATLSPARAVSPTAPACSLATVLPRAETKPSTGRFGMRVGILLSSTLTTPPMAPPPYSRLDGPRSTSTLRDSMGSTVVAWSGEMVDMSNSCAPSVWPRITGRPEPPP